ncbi:MAG: AAA family ATPase [Propionibacterium sp.]|nr:AAA family ATPase [Propionibacterium sp.]
MPGRRDRSSLPAPPSTGSVERELAIEQAHVDAVYARLSEATRAAQQVATEGRALFQSDRANFVRDEDGTGLLERDVFAFQAARRLATLDAEHEGLVFGRLDRTDSEVRYIGRIGVRDEEYEPLVIDWRARAAEPFYRATPSEPMEVVRRRVLRCRGERVIGIEDDLLDGSGDHSDLVVIGEGALMAALARARGHQMRDIVATIQAEQDEAIRAPYQGVTIINGGPGTGKTVVALHRAAYLLYSHRKRFENGGVLVVGPSRTFMNYIERVLPSLGEDSVTLRAIGQVPNDVITLEGERLDAPEVATIKGSLRMVTVLRKLAALPMSPENELRVSVKGLVLTLRTAELDRIRRAVWRVHRPNGAREHAERALLDALWEQAVGTGVLEVDDREQFDDLVADQAAFRMFCNAWWPVLEAPAVLARLADPAVVAAVGEGTLNRRDQLLLAESYRDRPSWSVADAALLDELVHILGPVPPAEDDTTTLFLPDGSEVTEVVTMADRLRTRPDHEQSGEPHNTYAHVLVDEAQDITPMQWRVLRRRGPQASWTIVGDPAQSSWPDPEETQRAIEELIGTAPTRRFRMSTNYRSPAEVFDLAATVVTAAWPDADLPRAVRSTGIEPLLLTSTPDRADRTVVDTVKELAEEVEGTIGVIGPSARLGAIEALLTHDSGLDAIRDRLVVITPLQAKGLEYDAVVVVDPDQIVAEFPGGVRILYVALTRPTQQLVVLDVNEKALPGKWRAPLNA